MNKTVLRTLSGILYCNSYILTANETCKDSAGPEADCRHLSD